MHSLCSVYYGQDCVCGAGPGQPRHSPGAGDHRAVQAAQQARHRGQGPVHMSCHPHATI